MAHWDYAMSGGAGIVQVGDTLGLPKVPGSVIDNFNKIKFNKDGEFYSFKKFLNKVWDNSWNGKYYSSLQKHKSIFYRYFYWWGGRYNRNYGNMSNTIEILINDDKSYDYYVGYIIFWNGLGSHRGEGYGTNPCVVNINITHIDGTTTNEKIVSGYINITHDIDSPGRQGYIRKRANKPIRKIRAVFNFYNHGAQWHDVGDRGYSWWPYVDAIRNKGINTHSNSIVPGIDYTSIINFVTGTAYINITKEERLDL